MKLPFRRNVEWHWRWLQPSSGNSVKLHRIARLPGGTRRDVPSNMPGETVCGMTGKWSMPGVFSRMHGQLCKICRRKLGVKTELGVPYNSGEQEQGCEVIGG